MRSKILFTLVLAVGLAACGTNAKPPAATATAASSGLPVTPVLPDYAGSVTASGVVVADRQASLAFKLAGNVQLVQVKVGQSVDAGQTLVQLDDTTQQIQLDQANLALQQLTSASALAKAQQALAQDQQDLYNQQIALNNVLTQQNNQALISNAKAALVLAQNALKDAQSAYDSTPGNPDRDTTKALAYQKLYSAQKAYDNALYIYNIYSGKANQPQVDEATAKVAAAKARIAEDQALIAALTGSTMPDQPSGAGYAALMQARLNVQTAQENLAATRLVAPFAGEVASLNANVGDFVSPGQVLVVVSDTAHLHVETTDLSERDVPQVQPGQTVTVTIKALNRDVTGKVGVISPLSTKLGGDVVYQVTILLDEIPERLLPGMSVDVRFNTGK
jgi:HlyD family secretion protein